MAVSTQSEILPEMTPWLDKRRKVLGEKFVEPLTYIDKFTDKTTKMKLTKAFNYWMNVPEEKLKLVASFMNVFHNNGVLFESFENPYILGEGVPAAQSIYGVPLTLSAAHYAIAVYGWKFLDLFDPQAKKVFLELILDMLRGQGMELHWNHDLDCPTEEEYCEMTRKKLGTSLLLTVTTMQLFSSNKDDFTKLTMILAQALQIIDDYKVWNLEAHSNEKSCCEDFDQHWIFSFPIIHAIQTYPQDQQIMTIIRNRIKSHKVVRYCASLLEKFGSLEYTRNKLNALREEARKEVERIGSNPLMELTIEGIFKDVV